MRPAVFITALRNAALLAALLFAASVRAQWFSHDYNVMGTTAKVELWHEDPVLGK